MLATLPAMSIRATVLGIILISLLLGMTAGIWVTQHSQQGAGVPIPAPTSSAAARISPVVLFETDLAPASSDLEAGRSDLGASLPAPASDYPSPSALRQHGLDLADRWQGELTALRDKVRNDRRLLASNRPHLLSVIAAAGQQVSSLRAQIEKGSKEDELAKSYEQLRSLQVQTILGARVHLAQAADTLLMGCLEEPPLTLVGYARPGLEASVGKLLRTGCADAEAAEIEVAADDAGHDQLQDAAKLIEAAQRNLQAALPLLYEDGSPSSASASR